MKAKENRYARFPVSFFLGGQEFTNESLISETGARRVFEIDEVPVGFGDLTGQSVKVRFRGFTLQGTFSKEILPDTAFYNIRFVGVQDDQIQQLKLEIKEHGFPSPWKRGFPRISSDRSDIDVEIPSMGLVDNDEGVHYFRVMNFTLGGLLMQTDESTSEVFEIGERFYLQLITTTGESVTGIWASIVRKDVELVGSERKINCGVQIESMSSQANKRYRNIILHYCEKMKQLYNV